MLVIEKIGQQCLTICIFSVQFYTVYSLFCDPLSNRKKETPGEILMSALYTVSKNTHDIICS